MVARWVGIIRVGLLPLKGLPINMRTSPFEAALDMFTAIAAAALPRHLAWITTQS